MNDILEKKHNPWQSLIILLLLTVAYSFGIQLLVFFIGIVTTGNMTEVLSSGGGNLSILNSYPFFMYALLAAGTFSTFYLPAILLQYRERYFDYFPSENKNNYLLYAIGVLLLLAFSPLMGLIGEWNANMSLPEGLKGVENWMRMKEEESAALVQQIVMTDKLGFLVMNIIVMAVFPAIAEEYYFRGSLMHIFQRLFKNQHLAIWVTAIIFSAIHVQFFGFFPRMILGVFFGYLLIWTNNIWVPILGHFVNNAAVTVWAYYYAIQGKSFEELQNYDSYSIFVYLGSFIATAAIVVFLYQKSKIYTTHNGERLG